MITPLDALSKKYKIEVSSADLNAGEGPQRSDGKRLKISEESRWRWRAAMLLALGGSA
jgi:hypothetical protein